MRLHVMFERQPGEPGVLWVIDAVDEYTVDEWNGAYPDEFQQKLDADATNRAVLNVVIPGHPYDLLWPEPPTVTGSV